MGTSDVPGKKEGTFHPVNGPELHEDSGSNGRGGTYGLTEVGVYNDKNGTIRKRNDPQCHVRDCK
jgi:hypothetical protein